MFRKTLIGLTAAAALAASLGATASTASAGSIKIGIGFGGYNDGYFNGYYDDAGYATYHCHKKYKWVKVKKVWYDDYGYKHVSFKWVKKLVKFCHYSSH
jgi:N-acetylneuraminic acid mutarotase